MTKIRIELEIDVRAFTEEELKEEASACSLSVEELGGADGDDELEPGEIADCIAGMFYEDMDQEMFAGSGIYAKLGEAKVISAEIIP